MMDRVVPGGVARDLDAPDAGAHRASSATRSSAEVRALRDIYDEHAGLQDRFRTLRPRHAGARRASSG